MALGECVEAVLHDFSNCNPLPFPPHPHTHTHTHVVAKFPYVVTEWKLSIIIAVETVI